MSKDFFDLILPRTGHQCMTSHANGKWLKAFGRSSDFSAQRTSEWSTEPEREVYFACATYRDPAHGRKAHNVEAIRSFWLDIDTNERALHGDSAYEDVEVAKQALARFACEIGLMDLTLVCSGYGLHAYWSMETDLAPAEWRVTADLLKQACEVWQLKVDHSRTRDIASILRVPGTRNWKEVDNPRPVRLLSTGDTVPHELFRAKLEAFLQKPRAPQPTPCLQLASNTDIHSSADHWFDRLSADDKDKCLEEMLRTPTVLALADKPEREPGSPWWTIVAAVKRSGAPNAYNLCRKWAVTSDRFDASDFDSRWRSFSDD